MRPGWPGSWPSLGETERRGYGKLSAVVKTNVVVLVPLLLPLATSDKELSGPESVNGEDTLSVNV